MPTPAGGSATHGPSWSSSNDALRFEDRSTPDRFCDLVLSGSVTSAVIYPGLVAKLASVYRFHAIGGTSSGAGIAAMAAAAELRRRQGSPDGFHTMLRRVGELADVEHGQTRLRRLFQPAPGLAVLFGLLLGLINRFISRAGKPRADLADKLGTVLRWLAIGAAAIALAASIALVPKLLDLNPGASPALHAVARWALPAAAAIGWLLIALACGLLLWLARVTTRLLDHDYGLCTGVSPAGGRGTGAPALSEWLHDVIQDCAGRRAEDPPLTFADLAQAPDSPREVMGAGGTDASRGIALQMYSANVSHGRPCRFPLGPDEELYFCPTELLRVLPRSVVEHLLTTCQPDARWRGDQHKDPWSARWRLPGDDLPVVVAVRLSVAFPVLFTAVRLWAPDGVGPAATLRPCLFLDGGLCSNFPIHLFDSAIPAWPTFGIALLDRPADTDRREAAGAAAAAPAADPTSRDPDPRQAQVGAPPAAPCAIARPLADRFCRENTRVSLPVDPETGRAERWSSFAEQAGAVTRLFGLAGAMLTTAKDWHDTAASRLPGAWDRVVRVELSPDQGGLNLDMTPDQIRQLADFGADAGDRLLLRYAVADAVNGRACGWNSHRWVRMLRLQQVMAQYLDGIGWSISGASGAEPLGEMLRRALDQPESVDDPLDRSQVAALERVLAALVQAEQAFRASAPSLPLPPHPQPELRQCAPL